MPEKPVQPVQSHLFPDLKPDPAPDLPPALPPAPEQQQTPLWLQRMSLFILVIFCIYIGVFVTILPWWVAVWDHNPFFIAYPHLWAILRLGPVRGVISGLGLLDIWIGISEAVNYRDSAPHPQTK